MHLMTSWARPRGTINHREIRGLAAAGLLCAALAGCGAAAAATTPAAPGAGGPRAAGAAHQTGCASVNQATSASVTRRLLVPVPVKFGARTYTQRNGTKVRALLGDFCAVLAHAGTPQPAAFCAANKDGITYTGTFYDGQRTLATFTYDLTECPRLIFTASGQTRGTVVIGRAAAAAPHLKADLAAVLGVPKSQVLESPAQTIGPVTRARKAGAARSGRVARSG